VKLMPGEAFLYYGDSANAPYGTRTPEEVIDLTKKDVDFLLERLSRSRYILL
jgi:glutamate racemase